MKPQVGDRVRIIGELDDPDPLPIGTEGTVSWLGQWINELTEQVGVLWDNGSRLIMLPHDPYIVINQGQ